MRLRQGIGKRTIDPSKAARVALDVEMTLKQTETPQCYLSTSDGKWRVIHGGLQVCADVGTRGEAMAAARQLKCTPTAVWDGNEGVFKPIDAEAKEVAKAAGKALEQLYPFGYRSADCAP